MLGILNLAAIQRRLSLDFSDVVEQGLSFDQATGRFEIGDGLARIERFELLSSTADIRITGTTNLSAESLDQIVTVTPKVGAGVALASAVAGGPLVGAAVLLADKVAGDAVDRLTRHQYRVTGPWRKPDIDLLGMRGNEAVEDARPEAPPAGPTVATPAPMAPAADAVAPAASVEAARPEAETPAEKAQDAAPSNLFLENF
jgi:uncharacterized protein YhdP